MSSLVIYDDGGGCLGPMTDLRPAFDIRTGAHRTLERIERRLGKFPAAWWVPAAIESLWASSTETAVNTLPAGDDLLLINGRWLGLGDLPELQCCQAACTDDGTVVAACLDQGDAESFLATNQLPDRVATQVIDVPVLRRPWDLMTHLSACLLDDLHASSTPQGCPKHVQVVGGNTVRVHPSATVMPGVVIDAGNGPVVIAADATIRPCAVLTGPCHVGRGATVTDGAVIRANTVIGPHCKIGGEIGASVVQGFSNKAHHGYLGDSYVGEWVNLGAGTITSNLLNTYGEISMRVSPGASRERTGRTFLGSIIGDHVKTAIGTRLMTGTVLGTGCMVATTAAPPTCVGALRWLIDDGERAYRTDKFLQAAGAMMARRDRDVIDALVARITALGEG
ncbi:MAG: hypothetical protein MK074_03095 [Phycisphaerales bacterium]|nr:hypothetical protein [Phycisphaerales bacterium]